VIHVRTSYSYRKCTVNVTILLPIQPTDEQYFQYTLALQYTIKEVDFSCHKPVTIHMQCV